MLARNLPARRLMQTELQTVLALQGSWVASAPSEDMALRGLFVRGDIADFVRQHQAEIAGRLLCAPEDVEIEGKDSTGSYSRVPWVRFANRKLSQNPREGWYAVYLFAEDGSEVSLSLNQGTQVWDGVGMRSRPESSIRQRSDWARERIASAIDGHRRLDSSIHLGRADKSIAYEAGNVVAFRYRSRAIPDDGALAADLLEMAGLLQEAYRAEATAPAPGDPSPEIAEAERTADDLAGRRVRPRTGFRSNPKQRKAVELRAMTLAIEYYEALGAQVNDVSAKKSYDLEVVVDNDRKTVEVKGTASDGAEILVTRLEVAHHLKAHPNNALVVVSNISVQGPPDAPEAVAGDVRVVEPWKVDESGLTPVAFRYALGLNAAAART